MSSGSSRIVRWIAVTLRGGAYLSALFLVVGIVWALAVPAEPGQAGETLPLGALAWQLAAGSPYAVLQTGILILLVTPLLRVAMAALSFWLGGERRYALLSLAALTIIAVTVWLAGGR